MIRWYYAGINTIRWLRWQQVCNVCSWSIQSLNVISAIYWCVLNIKPCFIPENSDQTFFRLQNSEKLQYYHISEFRVFRAVLWLVPWKKLTWSARESTKSSDRTGCCCGTYPLDLHEHKLQGKQTLLQWEQLPCPTAEQNKLHYSDF